MYVCMYVCMYICAVLLRSNINQSIEYCT